MLATVCHHLGDSWKWAREGANFAAALFYNSIFRVSKWFFFSGTPTHLTTSAPEMSGPSAVSKLQMSRPEMRVLYVTGYAETPIVQKLIEEEAILLQKPVSRVTLLNRVDELLHARAHA
jgi:DNA-binding NarL/FixJ family response regulator